MNPLESNNKLVTYHSWIACPLFKLNRLLVCVMGVPPLMPPRYLHLDLPKLAIKA